MSASSIGPVKAMVLATDVKETKKFILSLMEETKAGHSLRDALRKFAKAKNIPV
jgi:phosphotransferase system, enzyme I, PtsP